MKLMIAKWYKQGLWSLGQVGDALKKGLITAVEYREITGVKDEGEEDGA